MEISLESLSLPRAETESQKKGYSTGAVFFGEILLPECRQRGKTKEILQLLSSSVLLSPDGASH